MKDDAFDQLRTVLEFYASEETYFLDKWGTPIERDNGAKARVALRTIPATKPKSQAHGIVIRDAQKYVEHNQALEPNACIHIERLIQAYEQLEESYIKLMKKGETHE